MGFIVKGFIFFSNIAALWVQDLTLSVALIGVHKNFAIFNEKHLWRGPLFTKDAGLNAYNFI